MYTHKFKTDNYIIQQTNTHTYAYTNHTKQRLDVPIHFTSFMDINRSKCSSMCKSFFLSRAFLLLFFLAKLFSLCVLSIFFYIKFLASDNCCVILRTLTFICIWRQEYRISLHLDLIKQRIFFCRWSCACVL